MDAPRTPYRTPLLEAQGSATLRTAKVGGKPNDDTSMTGHFNAEGSLGFLL